MANLSVITKNNDDITYTLQNKTVIGRLNNNTIPIDDTKSSRQNSLILCISDNYYITDLKSRNGTFVNGEKIEKKVLLYSGDRIKIGNTIFLFTKDDDDPGATADLSDIHDIETIKTPKITLVKSIPKFKEKKISNLQRSINAASLSIERRTKERIELEKEPSFMQEIISKLESLSQIRIVVFFFLFMVTLFFIARWLTLVFIS